MGIEPLTAAHCFSAVLHCLYRPSASMIGPALSPSVLFPPHNFFPRSPRSPKPPAPFGNEKSPGRCGTPSDVTGEFSSTTFTAGNGRSSCGFAAVPPSLPPQRFGSCQSSPVSLPAPPSAAAPAIFSAPGRRVERGEASPERVSAAAPPGGARLNPIEGRPRSGNLTSRVTPSSY